MKVLFRSEALQKKFEEDGFVRIPLLSAEQAADLMSSYQTVAAEHEKIDIPYITTSHSNNTELITRVDAILQKVMAPAIDEFLINYQLLFGNYLVKTPVTDSETPPHQDITFVDESQYASVNIWVALQDTNKENGCMYFLKGSHRFMPTLRPTQEYPWVYENVKDRIKELSVSYSAQAGEAFVFNHAVVHGSFANTTAFSRVAAVIAAYPKEAQLLHYYLPGGKGDTVKKYSMTKDAYLSFVKGSPPALGVFLGEMTHQFKPLTSFEFDALIGRQDQKSRLLSKFTGLFRK